MANDQNRDQFDKQPPEGEDKNKQFSQDSAEKQTDVSSQDTLGQGQSGGFGNQVSGSPQGGETGQQSSQSETLTSERSSEGQTGENAQQTGGFVGSQQSSSDNYLREGETGQSRSENPDDPMKERSQNRDSDIEGSSNS